MPGSAGKICSLKPLRWKNFFRLPRRNPSDRRMRWAARRVCLGLAAYPLCPLPVRRPSLPPPRRGELPSERLRRPVRSAALPQVPQVQFACLSLLSGARLSRAVAGRKRGRGVLAAVTLKRLSLFPHPGQKSAFQRRKRPPRDKRQSALIERAALVAGELNQIAGL